VFLGLELEYKNFSKEFDQFSQNYFAQLKLGADDLSALWESMLYSFASGGKRFRPFLSYLVALVYQKDGRKTMSVGLAAELIHTYSLIHDDLPCMDNDDFRRGLPTNHKKFGEDIALLSGDALQSEAFRCLAVDDQNTAEDKVLVLGQFAQFIGSKGMVGGQVLDMKSNSSTTLQQLERIHQKKQEILLQLLFSVPLNM
jgi:geranylgeranyl diphosphate synthase type II